MKTVPLQSISCRTASPMAMALLALLGHFPAVAAGLELPARPPGPVADFAGVIDAPAREKITAAAQALWEQAGFGLVVATFADLGDESIDEFAPRLYAQWGIGTKGVDEGALVLLCLNPRKVRIEVGYGSEGYLNDAKTGRILDEYGVPWFRKDDFSAGLLNVSAALAQVAAQEKNITLAAPAPSAPASRPRTVSSIAPIKIILGLILIAFLLGTPFGRSLLWMMILSGMMGGGRRGGGFGGGFGGGGFGGGFGGGMSGGGGASRGF